MNYVIGFSIALIVCSILVYVYTRDTHIVRVKKGQIMEFKSTMDLTGLPIVTFTQHGNKYHFLFDTGSNVNYVNANSGLTVYRLDTKSSYIGADGNWRDSSIGKLTLYHNDLEFECEVNIADLSQAFNNVKQEFGVSLSGIIGTSFMEKYKYVVDFVEYVVYQRK